MRISTCQPQLIEERTNFFLNWKKSFFVLFLLLSSTAAVFGSHFRYGVMTATRLSETPTTVTYQVTLSTSWNLAWNFGTTTPSHTIVRTGGNTGSFTVTGPLVLDPSGQWRNHIATATVVLNKSATPTRLSFASNAKISTISNNANQPWDVYCILNTNAPGNPPVSNMPAIINMPIGAPAATYSVPVSDPDAGTTFTFGIPSFTGSLLNSSNPVGFSINSAGLITFNTLGKLIGQQYNAMITVKDNDGNTIFLDFLINMVGPSNPPAFDYSVTPTNGTEFNVIAGQTLNFGIRATDPDVNSTVSLSVAGLNSAISLANFSANPLPATGNPAVTSFSYTPNGAAIGSSTVLNFSATDNVGVQSSTSITIKVVAEPAPVFVAPTPVLNSVRQILTGVLHQDQIVASSSLGSNVRIAFATIPTGATLSPAVPTVGANPATTTLNWTPTPANWGLHNLNFQAVISNIPSIFTQHNYQLEVNTPPVFASTPPASLTVLAGQTFTYNISATDPDIPFGDHLDIIAATKPAWLTLTQTSPTTAVLTGTPSAADAGANTIHLELEDIYHHGNPSHVEQEFTITVIAGIAPSIVVPANIVSCNPVVSFAATETVGIPASTITYSIAPGSVFPIGTTTVTATATNSISTSTKTFTVTVSNPIADIAANGATTFCEGSNVMLNAAPYALRFNGSQHVNVANGFAATDDITIEATITPTVLADGTFKVLMNHNSWYTGTIHFQFFPDGRLQFAINGASPADQYCTYNFIPNTTYRIAAVYSRFGNYVKFYVNGVLINTGLYFSTVPVVGNAGYSIGSWNGNERFFSGTIDDFRVWNVQRTDAQVLSDAAALPLPTGTPNLITYYKFNEGSGTSTSNAVGNSNATLINNPTWVSTASVGQTYLWSNGAITPSITASDAGPYTVTVTDASGCSATSAPINVTVNKAPVFTNCPSNQTANNSLGSNSAVVSYIATATGSPAATLSYTFNGATTGSGSGTGTGESFNIGTTTVTITATNSCGTTTCTFTVKISDITPPTIATVTNINTVATSAAGAVVTYTAPVGTDNVAGVTTSQTTGLASGATFPIGVTTNTFVVTDAAGLTATSTFTVTVLDNQPPVISNPPVNITVTCESIPVQIALNVSDFSAITSSLMYESMGSGMKTDLLHSYNFDNSLTDAKGTSTPTNVGGVAFAPGMSGSALSFDGSTKFINLGTNASLNGAINFGISVWVKTSSGSPMNIVQQRDGQYQGQYILNIGSNHDGGIQTPGKVYFMVYNGTFQFELYSSNRVDDGKWHHIVAERQGTNGRIFIDGVLAASGSGPFLPLNGTIGSYVGRDVRDNSKPFVGLIDQLNIYAGGSTPKTYDLERNWTYTDASGNKSTAQQVVTVQDITAPVIGTSTIITPTQADGSVIATSAAGAIVNYTLPTATDNCSSNVIVTSLPASGSTFPIGTTTVTFTAVDEVGNSSTSTLNITVKGIAPVIVVPPTITVASPANTCGAVVNFAATETTGIPASTITYSIAPGSNFLLGTTVVTATATNAVGVSVGTFTITVKDVSAPTIAATANINAIATSAAGAVVMYTLPTATDNCSGVINVTATPVSGSVFPIGTTTVTVVATDAANNSSSTSFDVTVVGVAPVLSTPANISVNNAPGVCGANVIYTATESTVGIPASTITYSIAPGSMFAIGTTTVTVTATNAVGSSSKTFTVTVVDNTNPVLSLAPSDITVECDAVPAAAVLTATDNCSAVVTMTETRTNGINANNYTLTRVWTATDPSGNTVSATQVVTVRDTKAPSLTVPTNISVNNDNGICGATISFAASATDNCSDVTIAYSKNPGTVFPVGTTEVTVTATDATGNAISNTFTVTVSDTEKPMISLPAASVFCENTAGTYTLPAVSATDNCGVATVSFAITGVTQRTGTGFDAGTAFNVGVSTITYTVTDVNGNVSTKTMVVTVNKAPTATIAPSSPDAFCNKFVLVANSASAINSYAWKYNNNSFASTQAISLDNTNGDGTYSLLVTDNKGCTSLTAVSYQYSKQNTISNYTILAYKEAELKEYNTVQTGSVGVMSKKGKAEIGKNSSVASPGAFVKAPKIEVKQGANVPIRLIGVATVSLPVMQYNSSNTNNLPNFTTSQGSTISLSGNYKNLKIRKGSTVTLTGNTYGNIEIEEGSVVRFTSTVINVEHLKVGKGPNNGLTQVRFADNTSIRVAKHVQIEEDCFINPDGHKVTFYLGRQSNHDCNSHRNKHGNGHDDDDDDDRDDDDHDRGHGDGNQKFEVKGGNTTVIANVYAPTGDIKVKGGEGCHKNHSSTVVKMTGLFIGYEVEGDGRNVIWNSYACGTAAPVIATDLQAVFNKTTEDVEVADDLKVTVMPNPSTTYFTLKLVSKSELPVNIKVVDPAGRLVDAKAKQAANSTLQLGHNYATGSYFAEFIQGNQRKVVQLIKIK